MHRTTCQNNFFVKLFNELWADISNVKLLRFKILYFLIYFGVVVFYLQLTVHQCSLGLTHSQIGYLSSINYFLGIVFPFLTSVIADKIGNYKNILVVICLLQTIVVFLYSIIPPVDCKIDITTCTVSECKDGGSNITFWFYLIVNIFFTILNATTITVYEGTILLLSNECNFEYGKQRLWGTIGVSTSALTGGVFVDYFSQGKPGKDFRIIFYISSGVYLLCSIIMAGISVDFKLPATQLTKKIFKSFKSPEFILFVSLIYFGGLFSGYTETYMYVHIHSMGATATIIAATVVVAAPLEIILNIISAKLTNRFSTIHIMSFCIFCYFFRLFGLGLLTPATVNYVLVLELFDGFCFGLFLTVATMKCSSISDPNLMITMRGVVGSLHGGLGKMSGSLIGTQINQLIDGNNRWKILSIFPVIVSITATTISYITNGTTTPNIVNNNLPLNHNKANSKIENSHDIQTLQQNGNNQDVRDGNLMHQNSGFINETTGEIEVISKQLKLDNIDRNKTEFNFEDKANTHCSTTGREGYTNNAYSST